MSWKKAPQLLIDSFYNALPKNELVEKRKMFGYPCAFINRNMFCGIHEDNIIVRLAEKKRHELLEALGAKQFEPFIGRIMKEYIIIPHDMYNQEKQLTYWLRIGFDYAATLPPKTAKARKKK